jgi:hypothetical protein
MDTKRESLLTHEEVVCVWVRASNAEELHKVMKLAMNVATDCYRAFLQTRSDIGCFMKALWSNLLPAARLTPLVRLLEPKRRLVNKILRRSLRKQKTYSVTKP